MDAIITNLSKRKSNIPSVYVLRVYQLFDYLSSIIVQQKTKEILDKNPIFNELLDKLEHFVYNFSKISTFLTICKSFSSSISPECEKEFTILNNQIFELLKRLEITVSPPSLSVSLLSPAEIINIRKILHFFYSSNNNSIGIQQKKLLRKSIEKYRNSYYNDFFSSLSTIPIIPFNELDLTSLYWLNTLSDSDLSGTNSCNDVKYIDQHLLGQSYRCTWSGVMIKVRKIDGKLIHNGLSGLSDLVNINKKYKSHYISSFFAVSMDPTNSFLYLLSPLSTGKTLFDIYLNPNILLKNRISLDTISKYSIMMDVASAIDYLHSVNMVHGRLKDTNILIYPGFRARICDFGLSYIITKDTSRKLKGLEGIRWSAPEVIIEEFQDCEDENYYKDNNKHSDDSLKSLTKFFPPLLYPALDSYSLGLLLLSLFSEKRPYPNVTHEEEVIHLILCGVSPNIPIAYPDKSAFIDVEDICKQCLSKAVINRPTGSKIKEMIDINYNSISSRKLESELSKYEKQRKEVEKEQVQYIEKVKVQTEVVEKEKEELNKIQIEKTNTFNRNLYKDIDKKFKSAKQKLSEFELELKGLQEDLKGINSDLFTLRSLTKDLKTELLSNSQLPRPPIDEYNRSLLLSFYCTDRDRDKISKKVLETTDLDSEILNVINKKEDYKLQWKTLIESEYINNHNNTNNNNHSSNHSNNHSNNHNNNNNINKNNSSYLSQFLSPQETLFLEAVIPKIDETVTDNNHTDNKNINNNENNNKETILTLSDIIENLKSSFTDIDEFDSDDDDDVVVVKSNEIFTTDDNIDYCYNSDDDDAFLEDEYDADKSGKVKTKRKYDSDDDF